MDFDWGWQKNLQGKARGRQKMKAGRMTGESGCMLCNAHALYSTPIVYYIYIYMSFFLFLHMRALLRICVMALKPSVKGMKLAGNNNNIYSLGWVRWYQYFISHG